jgi:hypothetical protein
VIRLGLNRKLVLGLVIICIVVCLSSVSATEIDNNDTSSFSAEFQETAINNSEKMLGAVEEVPDEPDLVFNDTIYITSQNFDDYFDDNVLKSRCSNKTLIFSQDFENLGKIAIRADNVVIKGIGFTLKNTVFELDANNVTLTDLKMDLDSEFANNDYAGVLIYSDNAVLNNLDINYIVPLNVQAYGIFAEGSIYDQVRNLKIRNCRVNFEGHNNDVNVYNCALKLSACSNAIITNNTISSALPLKDIIFGADGAELASDLVLTVGVEYCDNLSFVGNTLMAEVNKRPENSYPSQDCMLISKSQNSLIANNSINMVDFLTFPGIDNYLYGLDIYNLNNLTVINNNISIITTGGKLAAGTAYPIQITGPISNVNITGNDLYSFSNGPNIGVYSQNFYGETSLSITNNKINVTGLAGAHEWALVAGIESQDTHSYIANNVIEVHSVADVSLEDNLYGISYRQKTAGDHQYNIQDNTVFSDGYYSVNLLSSVDSKVFNNLLVSYNPNADPSKTGYKYGDISSHENMEFYNNPVMKAFDYFASRENNVDNGEVFNYNPSNDKGISNTIDVSRIDNGETKKQHSFNPLIPGTHKTSGSDDGQQSGVLPSDDSQTDNDKTSDEDKDNNKESSGNGESYGMSIKELLLNYINSNTDSGTVYTTSYNGHDQNANVESNSSDATPSAEGSDSAASESKSTASLDSSAGESSSVSKKIFEIEEKNEIDRFIPSIVMIIPALILLFIGIRRKKSTLE